MNWPRVVSRRALTLFAPSRLTRLSYGWAVLLSSLAIWSLTVGMWYTFGIFFKPVSQDFGWSRASTSLAISIAMLTNGLLSIPAGILSDKYGPRRALLVSGVFTGLGYSLISQVQALGHLYLFYVLVGVGMTASYIPVVSAVSRWFPQRRGLALGLTGVGAGVGQTILPPLTSYLIQEFGWRQAYLLLGIPLGVLVAGLALLLRQPPSSHPPGEDPKVASFSWRGAMATRAFWLLVFIQPLVNFNLQAVMMHLVNYATDPGRGIPLTVAATFLSAIGLANTVGKIGLGALSDHIGRRATLLICFGLGAAAMLWLTQARSPWMFFAFAGAFGVAYGGWVPLFPALAGDIYGIAALGSVLGAIQAVGPLGSAGGSFLAGYIFDVTHSYLIAFVLSAGLFLLACLLVLWMHRPALPSRP